MAQTNVLIADIDGTKAHMLRLAEQAQRDGAELIVYPEMAMFGYPPRDLLERPSLVMQQWLAVQEFARQVPIPAIVGCVEPLDEGVGPTLANALVAIRDGRIEASYHKRLLPTYDVFDEQRYFRPGDAATVWQLGDVRIGLTICEDIWTEDFAGMRYGHDPIAELRGACELLVNCSASPYSIGKPGLRYGLLASVARRLGAPVLYVNQVGGQDELLFDGGSSLHGANGRCLARAPYWHADLRIVDHEHSSESDRVVPPAQELAIGDLYDGLVMGLRDYCDKTHQRGVVLGLSGGIDSAVVAALAVDALGADRVSGILMPGPYSSSGSVDDAAELAANLGIRSFTCPIGDAVDAVHASLAHAFTGTEVNVAEENIQARLRGVLVMAYANKFGLMALTTGNKSELAVGYCTIYGDMNGGLAPIGDVYKTLVWDLARYANREGERIPESSITKAPSAELRPDQEDSDSLPPYPVLDAILRAYVESHCAGEDIHINGVEDALVQRIIRLVEINEYKRRQAAPSLRVTGKAFGVGRRIPLARRIE